VTTFRYFLLDRNSAIEEGTGAWQKFLPTSRESARGEVPGGGQGTVTRGDYFKAVRAFLEEPPHHRLADTVSRRIQRPISNTDLDIVDIFLEKHGQFYHPAKVEAIVAGNALRFVVNAAFSATGRTIIETDFRNIRRINRHFPYRFLPRVYHMGEVRTESGRPSWVLFLGQWLDGYHEFHLHRSSPDGPVGMVIWDPRRGSVQLTEKQSVAVYRQAARILTATYNFTTSEQVGSWHHAAGDFVLRSSPDIDLKLVTVRQYRPLFDGSMDDMETLFQALLLFLLNLSVRTRIDRDSGTGDLLWSEELAVPATIKGFFEGLELQVRHGFIPEELPGIFHSYLKALSAADLMDLLAALVARHFATRAESTLVRQHLGKHGRCLQSAIGRNA